jgi:iron complex transport system ATP-binding protein
VIGGEDHDPALLDGPATIRKDVRPGRFCYNPPMSGAPTTEPAVVDHAPAAILLEAREVHAGYGRAAVLHGVSLTLRRGEMAGLIGPNGAGKSTLLRALSGVLSPRSGQILLEGRPVREWGFREAARRLSVVPQTEPAFFDFTVREVVLMGRNPHVGPAGETAEDHDAATRAMNALDILALAERPTTTLSGGEHRRVLIARALAQQTAVMLLDEPTAHLDLTHQAEALALLKRRTEREGAAVLAALHDLNLAAEFCDRILLLTEGRIIADGPPEVALTPELLRQAYGSEVSVVRNPASGRPLVLPSMMEPLGNETTLPRVHVICGGATGAKLLSTLLRRGVRLTAGVLNEGDSDQQTAAALGIPCVSEAPFSPIGPAAREACAALIRQAGAVVVSEVPFGRGNLVNLELALEAARGGAAVLLLGDGIAGRDFTGGSAAELWSALLAAGAQPVADLPALEEALRHWSVAGLAA